MKVAVWSSMMPHNLNPLVETAFHGYTDRLAFVWDQSCCTELWVPEMRKPLLRKDLVWLRDSEFAKHIPDQVLLIDDDPIKCTKNPKGTALHPSTWGEDGNPDGDRELLRITSYIKALVKSASTSAREYVQSNPFEDYWDEEPAWGEGENAGDEAGWSSAGAGAKGASNGWNDAHGEASWGNSEEWEERPAKKARMHASADSNMLRPKQAAEGYWPDDDTWLPAVVSKVTSSGYEILWDEDGSMSEMPADHVRAAW